jgi:hypothetical protein
MASFSNPFVEKESQLQDKLQRLADLISVQTELRFIREGMTHEVHKPSFEVRIVPGRKYTKLDVGRSGKYMVDNATEEIFGIKAYGVIHKGHRYGTLDHIENWYWGGYSPVYRQGVR